MGISPLTKPGKSTEFPRARGTSTTPIVCREDETRKDMTELNADIDVSKARDDTPTFASGIVYLDHAAGSVPPIQVLDATRDYPVSYTHLTLPTKRIV